LRRRELPTEHRAQAPLRLDFAGGWTDVPPFSQREGGVVVNGALALYARAELKLGGTVLRLVSEDLKDSLECANASDLRLDGRLDLLKAALRMFPVTGGLTLTTRSDAPAGSGLGSSGAMDVALVAMLTQARQERPSERELAEYGWHLEVKEAGHPGGKQDQYAAALGGFNRFSFRDPDTGIEPVTLDPVFAAALERQLVLCYTGTSRVSGDTISRVMGAYDRRDRAVTGALHALKDLAEEMAEALRGADLAKVGRLLAENWQRQQALDAGMRTTEMARLEQKMADAKVLGGKAAGAGAGGCMFFLTPGNPAAALAAARDAEVTVLPVRWATEGVRAS
jgi:D-glycero-alpha-D-manno-heptose-7-phosphate kinase